LEEIATKRESDDVIMARELDDDQFVKYDDYINKEKTSLVDEQITPTENDSSEFENLESDNDT
jgi:hypothetical protein